MPMLVLSRKVNQAIMIGDNVRIVIVGVERDQVKVGIEAPRDIPVHRSEVYEEIQRSNRQAVEQASASPVPVQAGTTVSAPLAAQSRPRPAKVPPGERRRRP
jgi:carbon storage regulator